MFWLGILIVVGIILFFVIRSKTSGGNWAGKVSTAAEARLNKMGDAAISSDPLAVMNLENERDATTIRSERPKLENLQGSVNRMKRQLDDEAAEIAKTDGQLNYLDQEESKTRAAGDAAGADKILADYNTLDVEMQNLQKTHATTIKVAQTMESQLTTAKSAVSGATGRIQTNQKKASDMGRQLENSQVVKESLEIGRSVAATDLSGIGAASKAQDMLQRQIDANMASVEVDAVFNPTDSQGSSADDIHKRLDAQMATASASDRLAARRAARNGPTAPVAASAATPVAVGT
jgi:chromosome segregation ATPase